MYIIIILVLLACCAIFRLISILPGRVIKRKSSPKQEHTLPIRTLVVLGSGGHTGEIMAMIQKLDPTKYRFEFVVAQTDESSEAHVRNLLKDKSEFHPLSFHHIPRSREVHQSLFTSVFTTLWALVYTTFITNISINPDLVC